MDLYIIIAGLCIAAAFAWFARVYSADQTNDRRLRDYNRQRNKMVKH
ncbi:hypothetical protein [Mucilaginibacter sp. CSA2-8R]